MVISSLLIEIVELTLALNMVQLTLTILVGKECGKLDSDGQLTTQALLCGICR